MNVAILGIGRLGLPMAAVYASAGHRVIGVDKDDARIEQLMSGSFRTDEPEVDTLLAQHKARLSFTRLPAEAVHASEIVFVVVPTPSKADGTFDSSLVVTACQQIGAALYEKKAYTLVVIVSTLMPGQMDSDVVPALERASGKQFGFGFGLVYSPEFIALGRVVQGLRKPDYILLGTQNPNSPNIEGAMIQFYSTVTTAPIRAMSFVNAELAKLATNAYLSLKIAYANVLGQICEQLPGANVDVVTQTVGSDHRIGGAYLRAGLPAGGVCLPRDLAALSALEGEYWLEGKNFSTIIDQLGDDQITVFVGDMRVRFPSQATRFAVLGTSYSPDASITEHSAGMQIVEELLWRFNNVSSCILAEEAQMLVGVADVVILALPLDSYKALKFHSGQKVFDLWRVLDPATLPPDVTLWQFGVGAKAGERVR